MKRLNVLALFTLVALVVRPPAPVSAQIAVLSDAVSERDAQPGQTYESRVLVRNVSNVPQQVRAYQTDYTFAADGRTGYGAPGSMARSNAKWITLSTGYLTIPPETTMPVVCTITVPTDSSLRGSYWSMVMIEAITPNSPEAGGANARVQVGLSVTTRYGMQIATNIGTSGVSKLAFDSLTATTSDSGRHGLRFDFINTGERAHRFTMSLELYNEAGELVTKASQSRGLLYPGTAARQVFDVGTVPHGAYTAVLVADGGGDQVFGGQFKISY